MARLRSQGGTWQDVIAQLLDVMEFLTLYQKRRHELQAAAARRHQHSRDEARKRKRERRRTESSAAADDDERSGSDSSSSSSSSSSEASGGGDLEMGPEERHEARKVLDGIGHRLSALRGQMDRVLQERDFGAMPRVATTVLKVWVMMVDTEYRTCLDAELGDDRKASFRATEAEDRVKVNAKRARVNGRRDQDDEGQKPRENGRTTGRENGYRVEAVKSEGRDDDDDDNDAASLGEEAGRVDNNKHDRRGGHWNRNGGYPLQEKSWSERGCEEMVEFFATLEVPLRGVCMSVVHNFLRGSVIDILHRARNAAALRLLLDLISPLAVVASLSDIRHRLIDLLAGL
jgi:hypothetical protein